MIRKRMQIPYFNAPIFLENKSQIGKVDEIFGKIQGVVRFKATAGKLACPGRLHDFATGSQCLTDVDVFDQDG